MQKYLVLNSILNISQFKHMKQNICKIILRHWIKINQKIMPSFKIIHEIYNQIMFTKADSQPKFQFKNHYIQKYKNHIYWIKEIPNIENLILTWNNINKPLTLPYQLGMIIQNKFGITIPCPQENEVINIRFYTSKKFITKKNTKRTTLKKIFKIHQMPPWYRKKIPLLFYNNNLICAFSLFNIYQKHTNSVKKIKLSWIDPIH